jgi:hypothetical protein
MANVVDRYFLGCMSVRISSTRQRRVVTAGETVNESKINDHRVGRRTLPEHSKFGARVQEVGPFNCDDFANSYASSPL